MRKIDKVTCGDQYTDAATIQDIWNSPGGYFSVQNNELFLQLQWGRLGQEFWTDEVRVPVGNGSFAAGTLGARFRNATAGQNGTVTAALSAEAEPVLTIGAGTSSGVTINGVTGVVAGNGSRVGGSGFTSAHVATGQYSVTYTTPFVTGAVVVATVTDPTATSTTTTITNSALTGFSINVHERTTGNLTDYEWNFIAIALQ